MTDFTRLLKALKHLDYSYKKVLKLSSNVKSLSTDQLEVWEAFVSRFARVSDIFLSKYIRTYVLKEDLAFRGSFRDFLDQAEKLGFIEKAQDWMNIRELRNLSAHEYSEEKLTPLLEGLRLETPRLLELKSIMAP